MLPLPPIKGIQANSLVDWPGRMSAVLFLPKCNLRCPFCHAGDLVLNPAALPTEPFDAVEAFLRDRSAWLDGVVITGGEPTLWDQRLDELARRIKLIGYGVKLDTNGTNPDVLERLLDEGLVDWVSMDVKGPLDERYERASGRPADLDALRRSIDLLRAASVEVEFRTTVCPSIHTVEDIGDTARAIAGQQTRYVLQGFRPVEECLDPSLRQAERVSPAFLEAAANAASRWTPGVSIRGRHDRRSTISA